MFLESGANTNNLVVTSNKQYSGPIKVFFLVQQSPFRMSPADSSGTHKVFFLVRWSPVQMSLVTPEDPTKSSF